MAIAYDENRGLIHLQANNTSYLIQITPSGQLSHLYWGRRIRSPDLRHLIDVKEKPFSPKMINAEDAYTLDVLPQEYPSYGHSDFRAPAFQVQLENGSTITFAKYITHRIFSGKPKIEGLPTTYVEDNGEAETLEVELCDRISGLSIFLSYSVFSELDVITRSVRFLNIGKRNLKLMRALSMCIDFINFSHDVLHLSGAWAEERMIERHSLKRGMFSIESRRGTSSHQQNPFLALLAPNASEDIGEVYGFSLVYSGNFLAFVEIDQFNSARIGMGINPFDFCWLLEPGDKFHTPEVIMVYSDQGLGRMSRTYHSLFRKCLCRGYYRDKPRPILVNSWETVYFDVNEDAIQRIATIGKTLGLDLLVLDDGWFGQRDDDTSSLGDWTVNKDKFPEGLVGVANRIIKKGMQFGLWIEPEMVSPNSNLYRSHPDWCIHVPDRERSLGRNQLVLDLSRKDVCDEIIITISKILKSAPISYVKWDMNRYLTEIGSALLPPERQRETAHRYILGLYRILDEITSSFPKVLFEGCAGGGGRFDPGMLYYMPQIWTSDSTDAIERLKIQYGTSILYPPCTMAAHVTAVPNHQVSRVTPLETRGNVAMSGIMGYELALWELTPEERSTIRNQIEFYRSIQHLIMNGDFFRLLSPFEGNETAWMFVSSDKEEAVIFYFQILARASAPQQILYLRGLHPLKKYVEINTGLTFGGDELIYGGIKVPELKGDFQSVALQLRTN